jgi:hypothetical protein
MALKLWLSVGAFVALTKHLVFFFFFFLMFSADCNNGQTEVTTRIMIFSQYRDSVEEITNMLKQHEPLVKAMSFIGQSSSGKAMKGFTQKEQLKVWKSQACQSIKLCMLED